VVLHSDPRWLPVRKRAWASWNYRLSEQDQASACVTYNMNILQGLPAGAAVLRHPQPGRAGGPALRLEALVYEHPLFNPQSWSRPDAAREINGQQKLVLRRLLVQRFS
jgi:predicted NAD/FAD-binding protein